MKMMTYRRTTRPQPRALSTGSSWMKVSRRRTLELAFLRRRPKAPRATASFLSWKGCGQTRGPGNYMGVREMASGRFEARLQGSAARGQPKGLFWSATFDDEATAARAVDAVLLKNKYPAVNFPGAVSAMPTAGALVCRKGCGRCFAKTSVMSRYILRL